MEQRTVEEGFISKEGGFVIANKECGDHGVRWRLAYSAEISSHS